MIPYLGNFAEDETVYIPWHSFDASGASVTATGFVVGDLAIYKDGNAIQKTSTNGLTVTTDFDSKTGLHLITIDTSNDTGDVGFWVTGSDYLVAVDAVTVDSQSIRFWVGQFSIENRFMRGTDSAALASVATEARLAELDAANIPADLDAVVADAIAIEIDTQDIQARLPAALVGGRIDATIDGTGFESGAIDALLQRQITEAYNVDGTAPTVEQALMGIFQCLTEFAIDGTTITVKKLDGATAAMTFTLDDASNPTSRTRAT